VNGYASSVSLRGKFSGVNQSGMPGGKSSSGSCRLIKRMLGFPSGKFLHYTKITLRHFYRTTSFPAIKKQDVAPLLSLFIYLFQQVKSCPVSGGAGGRFSRQHGFRFRGSGVCSFLGKLRCEIFNQPLWWEKRGDMLAPFGSIAWRGKKKLAIFIDV